MWNAEKVEAKASNDDKEAVVQQMKTFVKELYSKPEVAAIGASRGNSDIIHWNVHIFDFTKFKNNHFVMKIGPVGQLVIQMFKDAHRASQMIVDEDESDFENVSPFPKPSSREFILKVNMHRPYTYSAQSPQRLFCKLSKNEFRIAGAFTLDQQFLWKDINKLTFNSYISYLFSVE